MLKCTFASATESLEESALEGIFVQSVTGELGILRDHLPIVVKLKDNSLVRLKTEKNQKKYLVGKNTFLQFSKNEALILAQSFSEAKNY